MLSTNDFNMDKQYPNFLIINLSPIIIRTPYHIFCIKKVRSELILCFCGFKFSKTC